MIITQMIFPTKCHCYDYLLYDHLKDSQGLIYFDNFLVVFCDCFSIAPCAYIVVQISKLTSSQDLMYYILLRYVYKNATVE